MRDVEHFKLNFTDEVTMTRSTESGNKNSGKTGIRSRIRGILCRTAVFAMCFLAFLFTCQGFCEETASGKTGSAVSANGQEKDDKVLPADPGVLIYVSGDDHLTSLFRGELEACFFKHGLNYFSVENIPELKEKVTMGRTDIKWYEIRQLVPGTKAQILVIADIGNAGSVTLDYHGRETRMTNATFTVRALDLASGNPAASPEIGQFRYTPLNMFESLHQAVAPGADRVGKGIREFWMQKRKKSK